MPQIDNELFKDYRKKPVVVQAYQTTVEMNIKTLEGKMKANVGDYIIKGVKGEYYPCKPDIFYETYEKVTEPKSPSEYFKEWENHIEAINKKTKKLITLRETYAQIEQEILETTDFKELYGANNQKVRDNHIKNELKDMVDEKHKLELEIEYSKRRIDFISKYIDFIS